MQHITVELNIPIPEDSIIIKRVEWEELKRQELTGVYWTMKELEARVGRKSIWIKENILFPSRFRKILDSKQGGFVYYPRSQGETWSFHASRMAEFLDRHFSTIFGSGGETR